MAKSSTRRAPVPEWRKADDRRRCTAVIDAWYAVAAAEGILHDATAADLPAIRAAVRAARLSLDKYGFPVDL